MNHTEKVKILVVEDELIVAEELVEILAAQGFEVTGRASDARKALQLAEANPPDIALLDINIDGESDGIELARNLKERLDSIGVIFLTALDDKELLERALEAEPAAYIVKPFEVRNLIVAIHLALKNLEKVRNEQHEGAYFVEDRIFIKEGNRFNKLMVNEITHVVALGSYSDIFTRDKKITLALNLKNFMSKLASPKFIRVHRSHLVNVDSIDSLEGNTIHIGSHRIPISASHREDLLKTIRMI